MLWILSVYGTHFNKYLIYGMESDDKVSGGFNCSRKLVIIVGPTASGKTKFSVDFCKKLKDFNINSEIINSDSMQVYKGFNIGTAKPSEDELSLIPHHLLNFVDPTEDYNVSMFVKDCSHLINVLFSENKLPVIVGGTNLYIEALLWPSVMDSNHNNSESLEEYFDELDTRTLYNLLTEIDPERAKQLHQNDRKRILRSLDIYHSQGITHTNLIKLRKDQKHKEGIRYDPLVLILKSDPEIHRLRIKERVQSMLKSGILRECKELLHLKESNQDLNTKKGIFQSIAYKELIPLINYSGFNDPSEELLDKCATVLESKTWQYSQRQRTWINNRLLKSGLKTHIINTSDVELWNKLVMEGVEITIKHLKC
ncbi:tRNA dimethylallyltransferase [Theileria parva strain Muguga]|uniref:tRNA dimethylallyltransferase n=1 Tax=Theileria parva strain Muguga TaxID=333668 RepID=UPI001C6179E5|nr:tRNA dimethylallyltransferase [Theileria parva strain Muguga]EAN33689.2 tRNA dimethylallyltransferase [Theileria parva strain Muguga]